jgi:uncharacterized protein YcbX
VITLAHIIRHPIKSVGYEEIERAPLGKGRALAFDRHWAISHECAKFADNPDGKPTEWAAKVNFLRGVAGHELMAVQARMSGDQLTLIHPQAGTITLNPDQDEAALIAWIATLWPSDKPAPARVVSLQNQAFGDWPDPFLAIIGTASNAELAARMDHDLSIHRWRANLWLDGLKPFAEFDLIGKRIRIGTAVLQINQRITRCKATTVNPATGIADADTLRALRDLYGHQDFGVYATVVQSGDIARGDTLEIL